MTKHTTIHRLVGEGKPTGQDLINFGQAVGPNTPVTFTTQEGQREGVTWTLEAVVEGPAPWPPPHKPGYRGSGTMERSMTEEN